MVATRPGVNFTEFTGGYRWYGNNRLFTFPRAQYGESATDTEEGEELKWYVVQVDKAAWDYFIAERPAPDAPALPASAFLSKTMHGPRLLTSRRCPFGFGLISYNFQQARTDKILDFFCGFEF